MKLNKYKLGELIRQVNEKNTDNKYKLKDVKGISIKKEFIETKADMSGVSLRPYLIVKPDYFAYVTVTSRNGEKITIAHNDTENTYIVSSSYIVFEVVRKDLLNTDYLFMYFNRFEFDRYSRFNSWGSARETFSWDEMCDIDIELPDLKIQEKYINIYKAMIENQKSYEKGLDDLKLTCDAYIENLRRNNTCFSIRDYISETNERNINLMVNEVQGVNSSSEFGETKADTSGLDFHNYKIVHNNFFAYNPSRINLGSIALRKGDDCIVSPMYCTFRINDEKLLLPEYLMMWFNRKEFQRSTWYYASGSVRDTFNFSSMKEVEIPIPKIEIQKDIVNIYQTYLIRKEINEKLKNKLKELCPILIKGSIEEAKLS